MASRSEAVGRWPVARGQGLLLAASLVVVVGSFLPWVSTPAGNLSGMAGAGLWTFYAGLLGLAGALVPRRTPALVQGVLLGLIAVALPAWQIARLVALATGTGSGVAGALPAAGLLLVLGGGLVASEAARRIARG